MKKCITGFIVFIFGLTSSCSSLSSDDLNTDRDNIYIGTYSNLLGTTVFQDKKTGNVYTIDLYDSVSRTFAHKNQNKDIDRKILSLDNELVSRELPNIYYLKVKAKIDKSVNYNFNGSPFSDITFADRKNNKNTPAMPGEKYSFLPKGRMIIEKVIEMRLPHSLKPDGCQFTRKLCTAG